MRESLAQIGTLIEKEFRLEWRQRYALNGMLLYIVGAVFICYLSFNAKRGELSPIVWNTLFWLIQLFTAINAIAKTFVQERAGRQLYYHTLASPQQIIVAKIVYNTGLMLALALLGYSVYAFVLGSPVEDHWLYVGSLLLGAIGFAASLTLVAGIAAKAENAATLMAILSFPVILPLLLLLLNVSKNAMDGLDRSVSFDELRTILAIDAIVLALSYLLFPFLWKS
ncbi:cytochrome c-type biogenesis protein CcmB [Fibrella aestuarina BUZ 2]|uniref:Cytochrome c-type biogenesis protein CcmB n=1 Tax=Fibrella aestuarina BUZ 2 TaxID=1166018 RepID=I0K6Z6_9BACT|nr:heme exporter protein CcmB [Fibrella aestuarina]CCG99899.1 cytochrome c-type biogenesis protein CcmB [Fibrella aestuarina BUZ 2]